MEAMKIWSLKDAYCILDKGKQLEEYNATLCNLAPFWFVKTEGNRSCWQIGEF